MNAEADFKRWHVDPMATIRWNTVQFRQGFTKATMRTTVVIALWCWHNGIEFATEVKMRNGLRADIIIPSLVGSQAIEIMDSETNESLKQKQSLYQADGIECIGVPANDPFKALEMIRKANGLDNILNPASQDNHTHQNGAEETKCQNPKSSQ